MNENANTLGIFTENIPRMACPHCEAKLDVSEFSVFESIECPSCGEVLKVPGKLDDFILIDELGRGAMGCVYLAQDESLGRHVALKVIRREYGTDPKMLETVQREAQAMATLNHRNIVQVYSFGRAEGQPYFVMELLRGERLDEMMEGGEPVDEVRILEIAYDVALGLEAAERAGLTHGDIKPANILMNDERVAKVVDFGLAKFMDPDAEIEVWGTPYYIAPEKARKKGEDSRSDQFSLGGTLFHALAGHPPFDGENPTKVVIASLKEETPVLLEHNPNVTEKTSAVIRRMMDKNPNRRYPTYASLLADLEDALRQAVQAEQAREEALMAEEAKANRKTPAIVWILLATVLSIGAAAGFVALKNYQDKQLAQSVSYEGPTRQLHDEQLVRAEVRNLEEAARFVRQGDLFQAEERLTVAKRLIPENHSAMAWYEFFAAGIYFYAQDIDKAKEYLQSAAGHEELIFDGGRTPLEDPRALAKFALGELDPAELQKDLRKSNTYYRHLAQLAQGYRILLDKGYHPDASRSFQTYTELEVPGLEWPYVLVSISSNMHLPRDPIIARNPLDIVKATPTPKRRATPRPKPTKVAAKPTATPKPVADKGGADFSTLRIAQLLKDGKRDPDSVSEPNFTSVLEGSGVWITENQVVDNLTSLSMKNGQDYTLAVIFTVPESTDSKQIPLISMGNLFEPQKPNGIFFSLSEVGENGSFSVLWGVGDSAKNRRSIEANLTPGKAHLFSITCRGKYQEFKVYLDGVELAKFNTKGLEKVITGKSHLVFMRNIERNDRFPPFKPEVETHRRFILDHIPSMVDVFKQYEGRMKNWSK